MFKMIISVASMVGLCLLLVLLNVTTPATAGPFVVLLIFGLLYIATLGLLSYIIFFSSRLISHLSGIIMTRRPLTALTFKNSYYFSTLLAAAPVMIIGLQSVGSVGLYEYTLIAFFEIIGCIYIYKRVL